MSIEEAKEWANNEDWVIKQVSFLLDETDEFILLAARINPHRDTEDGLKVDGLLKLPKTWVRKRIDLTETIYSSCDGSDLAPYKLDKIVVRIETVC